MVGKTLLSQLLEYRAFWFQRHKNLFNEDLSQFDRFVEFVTSVPNCFERTHLERHITGSALILRKTPAEKSIEVLLTHHAKLNLWLQLGGHSDGDPCTWNVAEREAREESGLNELTFLENTLVPPGAIFDIDIHRIPARKQEPEHWHYDVRYLFETPYGSETVLSDESHDLKWFPLSAASSVTQELSMLRQFNKARWALERMAN